MGDLVKSILVYKRDLTFFPTAKTKKLVCTLYTVHTVLNFCKFLTLVLDELQGHALHKNGVEFHQESNEHGPRHVTRVRHVSVTCRHVIF